MHVTLQEINIFDLMIANYNSYTKITNIKEVIKGVENMRTSIKMRTNKNN